MAMYLAGGGTPDQELRVWQAAFEGVHRVLYWPFAQAPERTPDEEWLYAGLQDLGVQAQITTWRSPLDHDPAEIFECDLLFVGGGRTSRLVNAIRQADIVEHVRRFIRNGGRYYGGSAGAVLPCEVVTVAAILAGDSAARGMHGLHLLNGLSVLPHANRYPDTTPVEVAATLGHSVLAIPEASGVAIDEDRVEVLGPEPVTLVTPQDTRTLAMGAVADISAR